MPSKPEKSIANLLILLKPHSKKLSWGAASMFIYVLCWPLLAVKAGELIPAIGKGSLNLVILIIIQALCIFLVQKIAQYFQDTLLADPALRISQKIRRDFFMKIQKIELGAIEKFSTGDLTYRLTEDADRVGEIIYKTLQDTTPCLLQLIAVLCYMIYLDWKLSLATIVLAPIVALMVAQFGSNVMKAAEKSQKQVSEVAGLIGEAIQGLPLVRAYAAEEWMEERFNAEIDLHRKVKYRTLRLLALQHPVVGFIEASGILTVLLIGAIRIKSGGLDAQGFSSFVAGLLMLIDPIGHLTINYNEFKQGQASYKRLQQIDNEPIEQEEPDNPIEIIHPLGEIEFKSVSFSYDKNINVINDISFKVEAGRVIAIVGPSGAGKSTIFSLILKFKNPQTGKILFDNNELKQIRSDHIRRRLALVPQSPTVFSGTVTEAIKFGREIRMDKIIDAAKIANAHDFITKLKDGYNTKLEERATNISGGQLQRIAIARAVAGDPAVLLLDEATSALDAEAEESVQIGLRQAMKGRTVIIIAHRLSTVQEADQIIVLDRGRICEAGTHYELLNRNGRYSELCEKQFIKKSNRINQVSREKSY